jgi:hypothetical protein
MISPKYLRFEACWQCALAKKEFPRRPAHKQRQRRRSRQSDQGVFSKKLARFGHKRIDFAAEKTGDKLRVGCLEPRV